MTPTTANIFNLYDLYKEYFGRASYYIEPDSNIAPRGTIHYSNKNIKFNKIGAYGQDIWFPIELRGGKIENNEWTGIILPIDICTISVNMATTVVSTPVVERKGTVNEIVNIDDYKITVRGFFIGKNRTVPEDQIRALIDIKESTMSPTMHGGYPEMFLDESCNVVFTELEFPEVQGQTPWVRPFTFTCKSDFIKDLEFSDSGVLPDK